MKIGDIVILKAVMGWPIVEDHLIEFGMKIGDVGEIIDISNKFYNKKDEQVILYQINFTQKELKYWFSFEQIELSNKKLLSNFPHICPRCSSPAYIGGMNNVDCSNLNCITKE